MNPDPKDAPAVPCCPNCGRPESECGFPCEFCYEGTLGPPVFDYEEPNDAD